MIDRYIGPPKIALFYDRAYACVRVHIHRYTSFYCTLLYCALPSCLFHQVKVRGDPALSKSVGGVSQKYLLTWGLCVTCW